MQSTSAAPYPPVASRARPSSVGPNASSVYPTIDISPITRANDCAANSRCTISAGSVSAEATAYDD